MRVRLFTTDDDESERWFKLPEQSAEMLSELIERTAALGASRVGGFTIVGPAVEIRRMDDETMAFLGYENEECEIGCTCIMCIPGA